MVSEVYRFFKSYCRGTKGSVAIEFAFLAIPTFLMIFGVIEAGRIVWTMNTVRYAVEETCRYASINVDLSNEEYTAYAEDKMEAMAVPSAPLRILSSSYTEYGIDFVEIQGDYTITSVVSGLFPDGFAEINYTVESSEPVVN